jgi:uncharacterized linocin/CFP29 family protein
MANNFGRDKVWDEATWQGHDQAVLAEVGRIRVAQKVFPTQSVPDGQFVPADQIRPDGGLLTIDEGVTTPMIEIGAPFALTQGQIDTESSSHTGMTLAKQAARTVALAEDLLLFQGAGVELPPGVVVRNRAAADPGLLREADEIDPVPVEPREGGGYGEHTFGAVTEGISRLIVAGQPGPYALILESSVYADTYAPSEALTTTADRIIPLVSGGFYGTGALPPLTGLLISLGGEPTTLYVGLDATTAYTQEDPAGSGLFRVYERVQLVARDHSALVRLEFTPVAQAAERRRAEAEETGDDLAAAVQPGGSRRRRAART